MKHLRIMDYINSTPLAVSDEHASVIQSVLSRRLNNEPAGEFEKPEPQAYSYVRTSKHEVTGEERGVGVVRIVGTIIPRASSIQESSGAVSAERVAASVRDMAADPGVNAIVLDIDSPGGAMTGIAEAFDAIRAASSVKPVIAMCNFNALSAAYYLACGASEIVVSPSGRVGAIGVYMLHIDRSEQLKNEHINVTVVKSGEHKAEGIPELPLSEDTKRYMQGLCDRAHAEFVAAVAVGRGTDEKTVREMFGKGRMVHAPDALELGMVDRIATIDTVLDECLAFNKEEPMNETWKTLGFESEEAMVAFVEAARAERSDEADQIENLRKENKGLRVEAALERGRRENRINASNEAFARDLAEKDLEMFESYLSTLPAVAADTGKPVSGLNVTTTRVAPVVGVTTTTDQGLSGVRLSLGTPEQQAKLEKAFAIQEKEGIPFAQAYERVLDEGE